MRNLKLAIRCSTNVCCFFQFGGEEEEKIKSAVGTFCSNMPSALELIKSKKKKDQRFSLFMQVRTSADTLSVQETRVGTAAGSVFLCLAVPQAAERNRLCRRLQLKDIIPVEMLRFTKYPLLLDNIAKYTGKCCATQRKSPDISVTGFCLAPPTVGRLQILPTINQQIFR